MQTQNANWVQYSALVMTFILTFGVLFNVGNVLRVQEQEDFPTIPTAAEIAAAVIIPEIIIPEIVIPDIEDNLRNDFYEDYFADEYTDIKDKAIYYAIDELEDDEYEAIVDYLKSLLGEDEELNENSVDVEVEETEVEVTELGLGEDEDKSAMVTFEVSVKYRLEEGVIEKHKEKLDIVYDVFFDEGEFNDEEVELISIN